MNEKILNHYLEFSLYTNPSCYKQDLMSLPNDVREMGLLVRKNVIHRTTLAAGNTGTNADLRFGDMTKVPWWRQPEDDVLVTVPAMLAELYRRDPRGLTLDRKTEDKIVVTCRYVSLLIASILKSKGVPTRVRSGFAPYFDFDKLGVSTDHWINEYWDASLNRWVSIDVDGSLSLTDTFDPYDMPNGKFDYPADAWLDIRAGKVDPLHFRNAKPEQGAIVVLWALFYDFHSLMNNEILYIYGPACGYGRPEKFKTLTSTELDRVDNMARLMQKPDENFEELINIWDMQKDFRLLQGGLL